MSLQTTWHRYQYLLCAPRPLQMARVSSQAAALIFAVEFRRIGIEKGWIGELIRGSSHLSEFGYLFTFSILEGKSIGRRDLWVFLSFFLDGKVRWNHSDTFLGYNYSGIVQYYSIFMSGVLWYWSPAGWVRRWWRDCHQVYSIYLVTILMCR